MGDTVLKHRYEGVENIPIRDEFKVIYNDVFSLKTYLIALREWLIANGYANRSDADFREEFYLQRNTKRGKFITIRWRVDRTPDEDKTNMFKYAFDIEINCRGIEDIEFTHNGQKVKAQKGEIETAVSARLIIDPQGTWKNHKLLGKKVDFIKGMLRLKKESHNVNVALECDAFQGLIKNHFGMQSYQPDQLAEGLIPKKPAS